MNRFVIDLVDSEPNIPSPYCTKLQRRSTESVGCNDAAAKAGSLSDDYTELPDALDDDWYATCPKETNTGSLSATPNLSNRRCSLREDELSPLEDFYSLKNAAEDDADAQYYLNMFKRNHSPSGIIANPSGHAGSINSNDSPMFANENSFDQNAVNIAKRGIKGHSEPAPKKWFRSKRKY